MSLMVAPVWEWDVELMLRVKESADQESFALLLERYRSPIIQLLYRMVHNRAIAEELAQDVFLRVYRSRASYQPSARFTTWLYRIAMNRALNWRRDHRHAAGEFSLDADPVFRRTSLRDWTPTAEERGIRTRAAAEIRAAVEALPERQRTAVLLHKYDELAYAEIARVFGCSVGAVKSLLFRAYETLRMRLAHLESATVR